MRSQDTSLDAEVSGLARDTRGAYIVDQNSPYSMMLPAFALIPAGMGLGVPAMTVSVLRSVEERWAGTASALLNAGRQAAGAIGVAAFGALASGDSARVVSGLHGAAALSTGLLLTAAGMSFRFVRRDASSASEVQRDARGNS